MAVAQEADGRSCICEAAGAAAVVGAVLGTLAGAPQLTSLNLLLPVVDVRAVIALQVALPPPPPPSGPHPCLLLQFDTRTC